ncbi:MAG: diacylglycerol kinase family protein [Bacteroidia bacterium]|nr:diacylglycerol kinase family protein [Bacteroidia bacterium]
MAKNPLYKSFYYAFKGFAFIWRERNFKLHVLSASLALILGFYFSVTKIEWMAILLCIGGVMSLEIVNTAIENIVNKISPEYNETAGKIKDLSAAAVLVFSIASFIIGCIIFWPYL